MRDDEREVQLFFVGSGRIFFAGSGHNSLRRLMVEGRIFKGVRPCRPSTVPRLDSMPHSKRPCSGAIEPSIDPLNHPFND